MSAVLLPDLNNTVLTLEQEFSLIPSERKEVLGQLTTFVQVRLRRGEPVYLNFICTHNSRRSHIAQLWAQASAYRYHVENVICFSGGTEATAFNPRAVRAMRTAGFAITESSDNSDTENPVYEVLYSAHAPVIQSFSKCYDDAVNASTDFAAVMTCSHADENCPFIPGASTRIALNYLDPKDYDDTPEESARYEERVQQIGREMLYAFSRING